MQIVTEGCIYVEVFSNSKIIDRQNIFISGGEICFNPPINTNLQELIKQTIKHHNEKLDDKILGKLKFKTIKKGEKKFQVNII